MTVIYMNDYQPPKNAAPIPRQITFFGAQCVDSRGTPKSLTMNVIIENGNVIALLETAKQNGGIWGKDEGSGTISFLPYPCAAVEIRDIDPTVV